ncbi:MAG: intradiol ring-cleavage dioxygenase [Chloroflexota bacterium]
MKTHEMELHDDDKPVGRVLTRREVLTLLGGAGAAFIVGTGFKNLRIAQTPIATAVDTSLPSCVVKPAKTEGPYFVDEMLNRSDIRIEPSDNSVKEGALLQLVFQVMQTKGDTCEALEGAQVDVWHCDASGLYSDESANNTVGQKFLRGYQVTDKLGTAAFTTIYPGWYQGRTVHIHFKIRTDPASSSGYEFTSQLFFDEKMTDTIYATAPYSTRPGRNTMNATDGIFADDGDTLTLNVVENDDEKVGGYKATFYIALDLSETPVETGNGGGSGGNRPPGGPGGAPPNGTPSATGNS